MAANILMLLKWSLGGMAALFGLIAGGFAVAGALKDKDDRTRNWFGKKWEAIRDSPWLTLPDRASGWLLQIGSISSRLYTFYGKRPSFLAWMMLTLFVVGFWRAWGPAFGLVAVGVFLITLLVRGEVRTPKSLRYYVAGTLIVSELASASILWMFILLRAGIVQTALIAIVIAPAYWALAFILIVTLLEEAFGEALVETIRPLIAVVAISISFGVTITFVALLLGHVADPQAYVPKTLQMVISNIIFDGLTVYAIFAAVSVAVAAKGLFRIPLAVLSDIVIAAILACCSLYFGLAWTHRALSVPQVLNVLIARSPSGDSIEFSPYFWAMHTTFLPALLYFFFIMFCWTAKVFLLPVRWFFGKGKELNSPLNLTAALCALIGATLAAGAYGAGTWQEYVERHQNSTQSTPAVSMIHFEGMRSSPLTASKTLLKPNAFAKAQW